MVRQQLLVDERRVLRVALVLVVPHGLVPAREGRLLLLDDVRLDGGPEVVGLARQVGRALVVGAVQDELLVAHVAPEDGGHAQLVRPGEDLRDLLQLAVRLLGAPVDRGPDADAALLVGVFHAGVGHLVVSVRVREQFAVVDLEDEGDLVGVVPRHGAENAVGGGHGVAAALDGQLDDVLGVEVHRVRRKRDAGGVLDALVDGQDGDIAGPAEATVVEDLLHRPEDLGTAVRALPDAVHEVRAGKVNLVLRNGFALVVEKVLSFVAEVLGNGGAGCLGHGSVGEGCRTKRQGENDKEKASVGCGRRGPTSHGKKRKGFRPRRRRRKVVALRGHTGTCGGGVQIGSQDHAGPAAAPVAVPGHGDGLTDGKGQCPDVSSTSAAFSAMPRKLSASRLALPMRPPSMSGWERRP